MILAAGRGSRLAPLTATVPKALLEVGGTSLIERHLRRLAAAGFSDVVINLAHLGHLIEERLGAGTEFGLRIAYSRESDGPLETGGGITHALPLLGDDPFLVVNADIWTDCPFELRLPYASRAHLVVVPNPPHKPEGDFGASGMCLKRYSRNPLTYAGLGVYTPDLFRHRQGSYALAPLLFELAQRGQLSGELYRGRWFDIGTPSRLAEVRRIAVSC